MQGLSIASGGKAVVALSRIPVASGNSSKTAPDRVPCPATNSSIVGLSLVLTAAKIADLLNSMLIEKALLFPSPLFS